MTAQKETCSLTYALQNLHFPDYVKKEVYISCRDCAASSILLISRLFKWKRNGI